MLSTNSKSFLESGAVSKFISAYLPSPSITYYFVTYFSRLSRCWLHEPLLANQHLQPSPRMSLQWIDLSTTQHRIPLREQTTDSLTLVSSLAASCPTLSRHQDSTHRPRSWRRPTHAQVGTAWLANVTTKSIVRRAVDFARRQTLTVTAESQTDGSNLYLKPKKLKTLSRLETQTKPLRLPLLKRDSTPRPTLKRSKVGGEQDGIA